MGGEADGHRLSCGIGKLLLDLRRMAVGSHPVSLDALIDLAVKIVHLGPSACPGGAGLGVNNQGIGIDQPLLHQGIHRQKGAGRETPRIGNQPGLPDLFPVHLGKAVNRFPKELGRLMLQLIPFLINRLILDSEIGA